MPKKLEEYINRIGRTGRVGRIGRSTSFFDPEKNYSLTEGLVECLERAGQEVPDFLKGDRYRRERGRRHHCAYLG